MKIRATKTGVRLPRTGTARRGALLLALVGAVGCGELTAGGDDAEAEGFVAGDDPAAQAHDPASQRAGEGSAGAERVPEGTLTVRMRLFLRTEGGVELEVTEGATLVTTELFGGAAAGLGTADVRAASYVSARVVIDSLSADVTGGVEVAGVPLTGPVEVTFDGDLDLLRPVSFTLEENGRVSVLVDLNSGEWIGLADPAEGTVAGSVVGPFVAVRASR